MPLGTEDGPVMAFAVEDRFVDATGALITGAPLPAWTTVRVVGADVAIRGASAGLGKVMTEPEEPAETDGAPGAILAVFTAEPGNGISLWSTKVGSGVLAVVVERIGCSNGLLPLVMTKGETRLPFFSSHQTT